MRVSMMRHTEIVLALTVLGGLCSCGPRGPRWKVAQYKYKSMKGYGASLSASNIRGIGQKAVLSVTFDGNNLSQDTKFRKDITAPEKCGVSIILPCVAPSEAKWNGIRTQVSFDGEPPKPLEWVWVGSKTRNIAVLDSLTPGGNAGFIEAIERHRSLSVKIPCGLYDSSEVTFSIRGLERALISAGMKK